MKPLIKNLFIALVGFMLFASPAVSAFAQVTHTSEGVAVGLILAIAVINYLVTPTKTNANTFVAGVQVEIWAQYIIDRLFQDNMFLSRAYSDDQYVLAGKIVHIPQPGAAPIVTKNRSVFPAVAVRRTDTDIVYVLDEYTTAPTHIEDAEKYEVSYDKITSVYGDHAGYLAEFVANDLILKWLDESVTSPNKKFTTGISAVGGAAASTAATAPSATGNRLVCTHLDLKKWQLQFNKDNIPKNDRQVLFTSNMLDQFTDSLTQTQYRDFSGAFNAKEGVVGRLYGFDILDRSTVAIADSTNAIKALGAAGATTDSEVSVVWQKNAVTRALGDVKFFSDLDRPEYYGDVYSALLRMGGRRRRADDKGVGAIIQGAAA